MRCQAAIDALIDQSITMFLARGGNQRGGPLSKHQWWVPNQPARGYNVLALHHTTIEEGNP
jgi:hypothetical protein